MGCAIFFPLLAVLPFEGVTENGEYLTREEFWKRGDALIFLVSGPILLAVPYGVLQRKWWVRPYLIGLPAIQVLRAGVIMLILDYPSILRFHSPMEALWAISLNLSIYEAFWGPFSIWYLYHKETVVDFFTGDLLQPDAEIAKN
ncbi:MAG: hypothetical protein H0X47_16175 [Nitrospirales bacterium]|nr:hypothetical protein [Nitrospirales bacterium]